jgi:hypothetical protein
MWASVLVSVLLLAPIVHENSVAGRTAAPFTGWPGPGSLSALCAVTVGCR